MPFTIIAENCTGCSACEKRCPTKAISGEPKKAYFIEPSLCIDCGACGVICPDEAILDTFGNMTHVLKRAERPIAIVHPDNCNGCGVCIDVCPFDCIAQQWAAVSRQGRSRGKDLRGLQAVRRGVWLGGHLHHAWRGKGSVSDLFGIRTRSRSLKTGVRETEKRRGAGPRFPDSPIPRFLFRFLTVQARRSC